MRWLLYPAKVGRERLAPPAVPVALVQRRLTQPTGLAATGGNGHVILFFGDIATIRRHDQRCEHHAVSNGLRAPARLYAD